MALLETQNLSFTYPDAERPALSGVTLKIEAGSFTVVCGKSGCGKSTLLRHFKPSLTPYGALEGELLFEGRPFAELSSREQTEAIGFVQQNPDNQIVTDKVWHELAFGLESLGTESAVIRRRVAEMASFFGIQEWYFKSVYELSGGQKQMLALAAVMAMQPRLLILDEPTAQLDPIAAEDFMGALKRISDEIGTTILLSEHRLESALPRAGHVIVLDRGRVVADGEPSAVGYRLRETGDPMLTAMPTPMRVYLAIEEEGNWNIPRTVREGRLYLERKAGRTDMKAQNGGSRTDGYADGETQGTHSDTDGLSENNTDPAAPPVLELRDVWFRYDREAPDALRDLSLTMRAGEFLCVVGGNGTGKSTMLSVVTGQNRAYRGKVRTLGLDPAKAGGRALSEAGLAALPQDPQTLFTRNTIYDDLADVAAVCAGRVSPGAEDFGAKRPGAAQNENITDEVARVSELTEITDLLARHPYDVSGGEQQRAALAMALLTRPRFLLLDEPTKGMDSFFKEKFARILRRLTREEGASILMVSHDVEFCARHADRCALFFAGGVVSEGEPRAFFGGNSFYTTAANRMSRDIRPGLITADDIIAFLRTVPAAE